MSSLPTDAKARKERPVARGVLDYFPDAIAEVAHVSYVGNQQHNPGQEMHWAREKSKDHEDCIARHLIERGTIDTDGLRHTAKLAWRSLAMLQLELEGVAVATPAPVYPNLMGFDRLFGKIRDALNKHTCYLAGPMRGIKDFNFPMFHSAAAWLRERGWNVASPAEHDEELYGKDYFKSATGNMADIPKFDLNEAFVWDLTQICRRDAIIMLPGWASSQGACHERETAMLLKKPVYYLQDVDPKRLCSRSWIWSYGPCSTRYE